MKNKHLNLKERISIQTRLDQSFSIHKIASELHKSDSTIGREIQRNRHTYRFTKTCIYTCKKHQTCHLMHLCDEDCNRECTGCYRICNKPECPGYEPIQCDSISHAPFCCNGCLEEKVAKCKLPKYKYAAEHAHKIYIEKLSTARQGISVTPEEMHAIDELVSPLLLNGQSLASIFIEHKEDIPCSMSTIYKYVDDCYLTARNLDMPRKVKFKARYKHSGDKRNTEPFAVDRTYQDFRKHLIDNPDVNITEMDTVIGTPGGKVLLTLFLRNSSLMIALLIAKKTQDSVIDALNRLCDSIGIETFRKTFGVILTDRGTEFANPYALECDNNGEIKTRVFYCDPYCSWQKGMIEKNHEFIRYVLPSGRSFDALSQLDITLLMNHINSYPRQSLNNHAPFDLAKLLVDNELLKALKYHKIRSDDVILKPLLLRKPKYI